MKKTRMTHSGFTLIEIIVTLTVAAILSVILVQFMGTSISRSVEPTLSLQEGMTLQGIFENMNADYKRLLLVDSTPLATFKSRVESGYYGTYTVSQSEYIEFDTSQSEVACTSSPSECRVLKVAISLGDHSLVELFTR
ncbi:PulJ/GspJ family protein [Desulfosarcina ovata]|nr:type II secretion system protein [Desulfosarcina ovata]